MTPGTRIKDHVVYRCFDADGALLYVGMTSNFKSRMDYHRTQTPWWSEVAEVTEQVVAFGRNVALVVEAEAIKNECPRFNVLHNAVAAANREAADSVRGAA